MIGILLALQINNWNQNRINNQKEKVLLVGLQSDLQDNISQFEKFQRLNESKIDVLSKISSGTYEKMLISNDNTYDLYESRMQDPPPIRNNILQEMLSTGSISLLRNSHLKDAIFNYYTYIEDRSLALGILFGEWPAIISSYIPAESVNKDINSKSSEGIQSSGRVQLIQKLKDDVELLRPHVNAEMQYALKYKRTTIGLIEHANELLLLIEKELENYK